MVLVTPEYTDSANNMWKPGAKSVPKNTSDISNDIRVNHFKCYENLMETYKTLQEKPIKTCIEPNEIDKTV